MIEKGKEFSTLTLPNWFWEAITEITRRGIEESEEARETVKRKTGGDMRKIKAFDNLFGKMREQFGER